LEHPISETEEAPSVSSARDINARGDMTMGRLVDIEGVGESYAQKLEAAGVASQEALLQSGATPKGRKDLAERTGLSEKLILEWVNRVDLSRVKGIGEEYADLLEAAGVDTVPELAQRKPENLYQKLVAVNEAKKLVRQLPGEAKVAAWVEQAKELPRVVSY
jgi:predicted flap endonuclease-1-like 5' DNA nuclease